MSTLPPCPKCNSEYTYEDGAQLICPECAHEWSATGEAEAAGDETVKKDSVGNVLQDGDTIEMRGWAGDGDHRISFGEIRNPVPSA